MAAFLVEKIFSLKRYFNRKVYYITYDFEGHVKTVWKVRCKDVKSEYSNWLKTKAKEMRIEINNHWHNIMAKDYFHDHLTPEEYKAKSKEWKKILHSNDVDYFIGEILKGKRIEFQNIY